MSSTAAKRTVRSILTHSGDVIDMTYLGDQKKPLAIKRFVFDAKYGAEGGNAKQVKFTLRDANEPISVYDYFRQQYQINIQYWQLPLIETEKAGYFPMELCTLVANQKYVYKLSPDQVCLLLRLRCSKS